MSNMFPLRSSTDVFQSQAQLVVHLKSRVPGGQFGTLEGARLWTAFKIAKMRLTLVKTVTMPPASEVASLITERMRERGFEPNSYSTSDCFIDQVEAFLDDINADFYFQGGPLTDNELLDLAESVAKELWEAMK